MGGGIETRMGDPGRDAEIAPAPPNGNGVESVILPFPDLQSIVPEEDLITHRHFLYERLLGRTQVNLDWDHTITDKGPRRVRFGMELDPGQYLDKKGESIELENIDLILIGALRSGRIVNITTGKGANAEVWGDYLYKRMNVLIPLLGLDKFEDGRPKTADGRPVVITFTTGNGGYARDLITGEVFICKPIPVESWEGIQRYSRLLRDSTHQDRMNQIQTRAVEIDDEVEVITNLLPPPIPYNPQQDPYVQAIAKGVAVPHTNQLHVDKKDKPIIRWGDITREVEQSLTPLEQTHVNMLQADMRDFLVFVAAIGTKANLVLDEKRIVEDSRLKRRWTEAVRDTLRRNGFEDAEHFEITDSKSLFEAVKIFAKYEWHVHVAKAKAQGITYIDITAPRVHKRLGNRLAKNYAQGLYRLYGVPKQKIYTISYGDNPGEEGEDRDESSNDSTMLRATGGVTNYQGTQRPKQDHFPIYLAEYYGDLDRMQLSNRFFRDLIVAAAPEERRVEEHAWLTGLLHNLREDRRNIYFQQTQ